MFVELANLCGIVVEELDGQLMVEDVVHHLTVYEVASLARLVVQKLALLFSALVALYEAITKPGYAPPTSASRNTTSDAL